jgi:RHS repeat-associated protein
MTSRNGVTQSWTSANLPATLATSTLSTQFSYAPDRSRWKQVANYSGVTETTLFIGGLLERHTTTTPARTHWKHLIATPSGEVQYVRRSDGTTDTFYVPSDHLGSADAVLNSAGTVLVRTSFNAWGARRDDDWVGAPSSTELQQIADTTRHGFTGHDMLDNVGLVHMNGRVYDPAIGRFVSADPFVVPMLGTQGLNRYAYTLNSPLSYTDPSGFVPSADPHTPDHYQPRDPGRPCCSGRGPTGGPNGGAGAGRNDGSTQGHRGWSQTPDDLNVSTPSTAGGDYRSALLSTITFSMAQRDLAQMELITDVEAAASIADFLAGQDAITPNAFLTIYGQTLAGSTPANPALGRRRAPLVERFGQYGFRPEYIEPSYKVHRNNQVRHFVGYVVAGYGWSRTRADLALWYLERYRHDGSEPDYVLGVPGINLGIGIREGRVPLDQVGDWIRLHIGE